jgi:hypothetical protein
MYQMAVDLAKRDPPSEPANSVKQSLLDINENYILKKIKDC